MTDYTLTEELAKRLIRAMQWVERQQAKGASGEVEIDKEVPNHQFVVPDGTTDTSGGITYYSAALKIWNATSASWSSPGNVWAMDPNSAALTTGAYYSARQSGNVDPGTPADSRPLFIIAGGNDGACDCADPGSPPGGWTASAAACYEDFVEIRCNGATTEYRRVRLFLFNCKFIKWTGPWGTTNPPATP